MTNARAVTAAALALVACTATARPFRAMVTRTAETTSPANLELGLRYQGFFAGSDLNALPYHQLSPGIRFGLFDDLELNLYFDLMMLGFPGTPGFSAYVGDIPVGVQYTFLESQTIAAGLWLRGTLPVGARTFESLPSSLADRIPPALSDGTWDAEGTFIVEVRATRNFRVMLNAGFLYHGVRSRGPDPDFDIPEAIRADVAATLNLSDRVLLGVEATTRYYLAPRITPAWDDNPLHVEVIPHARLEPIPNLVIEAALGFAVTDDLREIYLVRGLLGFTYEFDLTGGGEGSSGGKKRRRR